jgi:hypothetical protein
MSVQPSGKEHLMNRTQRRLVRAAAPVAGLLAAGLLVWQGSTAAFTATTNNTADSWGTGKLKLQNNGGAAAFADTTAALITDTAIKPGSTGVKCITVESTGTLPGTLKMYRGAITGTNSANLAAALTFQVDAVAVSTTTNVTAACAGYTGGTTGAAYNGTLSGFATAYAGAAVSNALAGGTERVAYRIAWSLPSSVTDNTLQSSTAVADLDWEVQ